MSRDFTKYSVEVVFILKDFTGSHSHFDVPDAAPRAHSTLRPVAAAFRAHGLVSKKWTSLFSLTFFLQTVFVQTMWLGLIFFLELDPRYSFLSPLVSFGASNSAWQGSRREYNLRRALAWRVRCFTAWIELVSSCHGASIGGEFTWSTMEQRKTLFFFLLLAAQLCLSSTQVLRIGKRNSCLRTVLVETEITYVDGTWVVPFWHRNRKTLCHSIRPYYCLNLCLFCVFVQW